MDPSSLSSIEPICSSLSGLVELYRCINEVLNQPLPQQALASHRGEIYVQELVDGSVRFLDICSRRRIRHESLKKSIASLREMDHGAGSNPLQIENEVTAAVIRVVREASAVTSSIFNSVLSFLAVPAHRRPKPSRWKSVSRVVQKGAVAGNNELENLDMAIDGLQFGSKEKIQSIVRERLQGLDLNIERIERGTEGLFRELIHTRVCLLNIISR